MVQYTDVKLGVQTAWYDDARNFMPETLKIVDPVRLLEGVAIVRVEERPEPRLLLLHEVADRARELWLREQRAAAWDAFRRGLREQADVRVNEQHYLPLPD